MLVYITDHHSTGHTGKVVGDSLMLWENIQLQMVHVGGGGGGGWACIPCITIIYSLT